MIYSNEQKYVKLLSVMLIFVIILYGLLNIYGGYLWVHHCWRPLANVRANVLVCLFIILLYCILNTFPPVNVDIAQQEKHYYSSYIIVGYCP